MVENGLVLLKGYGDTLLHNLKEFIDTVETLKCTNEQWFLDFLDALNKQSVRY